MDAVPYEIRPEDIDEVISAYESVGGGGFSAEARADAHAHVMRQVLEIDETVRTAPGERRLIAREDARDDERAGGGGRAGDDSNPRRELALAVIEDILIRDGYIAAAADEPRVFPVTGRRGDE